MTSDDVPVPPAALLSAGYWAVQRSCHLADHILFARLRHDKRRYLHDTSAARLSSRRDRLARAAEDVAARNCGLKLRVEIARGVWR